MFLGNVVLALKVFAQVRVFVIDDVIDFPALWSCSFHLCLSFQHLQRDCGIGQVGGLVSSRAFGSTDLFKIDMTICLTTRVLRTQHTQSSPGSIPQRV